MSTHIIIFNEKALKVNQRAGAQSVTFSYHKKHISNCKMT